MVSIYDIKPAFQGLLRPVTRALAKAGVSANQVTLSAVALSFAGGAAVFLAPESRWALGALPLVLFVRMALNAIDGMLAREHDMQTPLGAILNELGDVVSDALLYLPFAMVPGVSAPWVVAFVVLSIISEMTGVVAVQIGASRRYDGPSGKSDRAFLVGAMGLGLALTWLPISWVTPVFAVACGLIAITILNRCRQALKELNS